jgi:hypothetical protein
MGLDKKRTTSEWFRAAADSYLTAHQGCPYCHGQHCVFRSFWGKRIEYYCSACEFSVCLDAQTGSFCVTFGETTASAAPSFVLDITG